MPPTVSVLLFTVTIRLLFIVTAPVLRFKALRPAKVKSPFQLCGLALVRVMAAPEVLSSAPPVMVRVFPTAPSAPAMLMFSVPLWSEVEPTDVDVLEMVRMPPLTVNPPEPKLLLPEIVKMPALTIVPPE